jgi:hypothetical protein
MANTSAVIVVPELHPIPNGHGEGAVLAKMFGSLRSSEAKRAKRIMGPSPNGEHIRSEQLSVKSKPAKKFAFRLGVGFPDFLGDESGMSTEELSIVSRAGRVRPFGSESPGDGVRLLRDKGDGVDDVPKLQVLCQLGRCANVDDGADPIVVAKL